MPGTLLSLASSLPLVPLLRPCGAIQTGMAGKYGHASDRSTRAILDAAHTRQTRPSARHLSCVLGPDLPFHFASLFFFFFFWS